jgi:hypothetical protein
VEDLKTVFERFVDSIQKEHDHIESRIGEPDQSQKVEVSVHKPGAVTVPLGKKMPDNDYMIDATLMVQDETTKLWILGSCTPMYETRAETHFSVDCSKAGKLRCVVRPF